MRRLARPPYARLSPRNRVSAPDLTTDFVENHEWYRDAAIKRTLIEFLVLVGLPECPVEQAVVDVDDTARTALGQLRPGCSASRPSCVWFVPKAEVAMMPLRVEGAAMDVVLSPFTVARWSAIEAVGDRDNAHRIDPRKTCCRCQMSYVSVSCGARFIQLAALAAPHRCQSPRGNRARWRCAAAPGKDNHHSRRLARSCALNDPASP